MNGDLLGWLDFSGVLVGILLSLLVFSYVIGDHFLFRLVIYGFIGMAAGFGVVLTFNSVIYPLLFQPLVENPIGGAKSVGIPLVLCLLLMMKLSRRWSVMGNPSLALLAGVGAAVVVGGALQGTLFPQLLTAINSFDLQTTEGTLSSRTSILINSGMALLGTLATLLYFHFGTRPQTSGPPRKPEWLEVIGWVGQLFIAVALGLIYAGILRAGYTALVERARSMIEFILSLLQVF
jgi:hypothetical protein